MALRVNCGRIKNKEIEYFKGDTIVRITDTLEEICDDFFVEEQFLEDEDLINVYVLHISEIKKLIDELDKKTEDTFSELSNAKGKEKIEELINYLKDYWLLKKIAVELLLKADDKQDYVLTLN